MNSLRVWSILAAGIVTLGTVVPSADALPLITSIVENGTGLNAQGVVVSSASSPGPGGTSGALVNESFWSSNRTHELTNPRTNSAGTLSVTDTDTLRPFPYYLLGLEYIQIANDNRGVTDFSLDVTLSAPVTAFLLLDNRDDGPTAMNNGANTDDPVLGGTYQWVIDDGWTRVNSGQMPNGQSDYVGTDEGSTVATADLRVHTAGGNVAGPGNGLNQFFAVYRKNFSSGNHLGFTKAKGIAGGNMYSVAVSPTLGPIVPGDVNQDGVTNINDYTVIRNNFNKPGTRSQGDLSGDGVVNFVDFRTWKNSRSDAGVGADADLAAALGQAVPEPGSILLALLAATGLAGAARRGR